jgi:hypothetical protein
MVVSASRRTDIPAFHSAWFLERLRLGYCTVRNPFDARRERRVSLLPGDADCLVFWTRNPSPLVPGLPELDSRQIPYYFQITLTGYPRLLEPCADPEGSLLAFRRLSDLIGPERTLWRYDPLLLAEPLVPGSSPSLGADFHKRNFSRLISALSGATSRLTLSICDEYAAAGRRFAAVGMRLRPYAEAEGEYREILRFMAEGARSEGIEALSCAEAVEMESLGIGKGRCVDAPLMRRLWGIEADEKKDPGQRADCLCARSVDIGAYDSCPAGCIYCYAYRSRQAVLRNLGGRGKDGEGLMGELSRTALP